MFNLFDYLKDFFFSDLRDLFYFLQNFFISNADKFLNILFYGIILYLLYLFLQFFIKKVVQLRLKIQNKNLVIERLITLSSVFKSILKVLFWFLFFILVLNEFKIKIIPIITGAGVLGATIVYLFQNIIQDVIKGWVLIFEDQLRKGEWVNINNTYIGKVIEFNLRYLAIMDRERNLIFIPNNQINTIVNLSREGKKKTIKLKLKRDLKLNEIIKKIEEILNEIRNQALSFHDLKIEKEFNVYENFIEVFISFKTKFLLIEDISQKIKTKILERLEEKLIEII